MRFATDDFAKAHPKIAVLLGYIKKMILVPFILCFCMVVLFVCAVLTTGQDIYSSIEYINTYIYQVLLITLILDSLLPLLNYEYRYHISIYAFYEYLCLLNIGQLYLELLIRDGKKDGRDYIVVSHNFMYGLLRIDRVYDMAYAKRLVWSTCSDSQRATIANLSCTSTPCTGEELCL